MLKKSAPRLLDLELDFQVSQRWPFVKGNFPSRIATNETLNSDEKGSRLMSQDRPWVGLLSAGFVTTLVGQIAFNLFAEGNNGTPLIPIGQDSLALLAALLTGLGTALISRSSFGLLRSDRPVTRSAQFVSEVLFTALMVLLSNMCGWLALEVFKSAFTTSEEGRLLSIPLLLTVSVSSLLLLVALSVYARHTPGTPMPWAGAFKKAVRGFRPWHWLMQPREDWKPTKFSTAIMYTLLYAGLSARMAAGITAGATLTLIVEASKKDEPITVTHFGGFIAALIFMGLGATFATLPERLLPERRISRRQKVTEELVSVAIGSFTILAVTAVAQSVGLNLLRIIVLGLFSVLPLTIFWGISTVTRQSIVEWRRPVLDAKKARTGARKDLKRLNQTYKRLDTLGHEASMRQELVAGAIASAKKAVAAANIALDTARGKDECYSTERSRDSCTTGVDAH